MVSLAPSYGSLPSMAKGGGVCVVGLGLGLVKREKLYILSWFDLDLPIFY